MERRGVRAEQRTRPVASVTVKRELCGLPGAEGVLRYVRWISGVAVMETRKPAELVSRAGLRVGEAKKKWRLLVPKARVVFTMALAGS